MPLCLIYPVNPKGPQGFVAVPWGIPAAYLRASRKEVCGGDMTDFRIYKTLLPYLLSGDTPGAPRACNFINRFFDIFEGSGGALGVSPIDAG